MCKGKIAFFDSGIGGLTVLSSCISLLGDYAYYYYGDNARAPYGNLPKESIRRYVFEAFEVFSSLRVDVAVVACNTATAVCMDELRERYAFPIVGTEPALLSAATSEGEVLVLATRATLESGRMRRLLDKAGRAYPTTRFCLAACDGLAGGIEKGLPFEKLKPLLPTCNPSAVVLGCTHYVFLKKEIGDFYAAPVFDGNDGVAKRLQSILAEGEKCDFIKNFAKSRDERPPIDDFAQNQHFFTFSQMDGNATILPNAETNKCLLKWLNISQNGAKTPQNAHICFLGSGREINYKKCEQMFVVDKKRQDGQSSDKT